MKITTEKRIWELLEAVKDPEVPVLSVVDLGVVRSVKKEDPGWEVTITPTYSGCPAMKAIEDDISRMLTEFEAGPIKIKTVLSPAWTTDWLTEEAKKKLLDYGIAPPEKTSADKGSLWGSEKELSCPQCASKNTVMVSQFGSTACKALYKCSDCLEPFDYFKCI